MNNDSIKEYYIKIEEMMNNAVNLLTAINQSLSTQSPEITVDLINTDNSDQTKTSIRIPSYLYLENKLEQLDNTISNLFTIPKSGEAWFTKASDMFKLSLVKSTNAPVIPEISNDANVGFNVKDNNIFKDMVSPKTFVRLNINNLPDYISQMVVNKIVLYSESDADYLSMYGSYSDVKAALFNKQKGVDYEEYESIVNLPIKVDKYNSNFKIETVDKIVYDTDLTITYKVRLNTLTYYDKEDSSIQYTLAIGDLLCLPNDYAIYKIKDINTIYNSENNNDENEYYVTLDEYIGHISLQTFEENSEMYLQIYNESYNKYHYVDIPLEENPRIIVFLSTIYNNIRSQYSNAIHLNLNNIYMKDENGNYILDENNNPIPYIDYYKKYCKNLGDLMDGISKVAYPQITNYSNSDLKRLTDSDEIKQFVTNTLYSSEDIVLKVTRINSHLIDDETSKKIISLHTQKNEVNAQLKTVQDNVDQVYTQLTTTDFSQESSVSQDSLRSQLNDYYNERITLQKQFINLVDNINNEKEGIIGLDAAKYRVRGVTDTSDKYDSSIESPIVSFLHENFGYKCDIIGMDVEYKYKTATKDSTNIVSNHNVLFTDWNKLATIERERYLKFNVENNQFEIEYSNYNSTSNVIKWNQIDIPINQGEDVVIRVRYKLNIGQPFINLYTPWSDEVQIPFPVEYAEDTDISSILDMNETDTISANFMRTLVNNGYEEHITDKIVNNSQKYYHQPEHIYSGFNTPENNLISLKDKLIDMNNEITSYKSAIDNEINTKYSIYLEWDNSSIKLSNSTINNVYINEVVNGNNDTFIKKNMNLVIKNTGEVPVKLYSIFPGNTDVSLLECDSSSYYNNNLSVYERIPLLLEGSSVPSECVLPQSMGQWIYFRQNNAFTNKSLYYNAIVQRNTDTDAADTGEQSTFVGKKSEYLSIDNSQVLLPYRNRNNGNNYNKWGSLIINENKEIVYQSGYEDNKELPDSFYKYSNIDNNGNNYLFKYENIYIEDSSKYLTNNSQISNYFKTPVEYNGAFLIPELLSKNQIICSETKVEQYSTIEVGKSLSIPILFEYFLVPKNSNDISKITKTISFDIKPSLVKSPEHYILSITAKYDYSQTLSASQSYVSLIDNIN